MSEEQEKQIATMTPGDADHLFSTIAEAEIEEAKISARFDLAGSRLKAKAAEKLKPVQTRKAAAWETLAKYIVAHEHLFEDPRTRKTPYGIYGLKKAKDKTEIVDAAKVIEFSDAHNLSLYETKKVIDKDAVAKELESGKVTGAKNIEGKDEVYAKVEKKLLDKATRETVQRLSPPTPKKA